MASTTEPLGPLGSLVRIDRRTGTVRQREYQLQVVSGPEAGKSALLQGPLVIGTGPGSGFALSDPSISRQHLELTPRADGVRLKDLDSTNGTFIAGARVSEVIVESEVVVQLGRSAIRILVREQDLPVVEGPSSFGDALGSSAPMRRLFAVLQKLAPSAAPVVLAGETGTGKEVLARGLHQLSLRRDRPFVIFDCGAVSPSLVESELFGHGKGAFTGAQTDRRGAFLQADGGTLFLDEIGELPLELQPKLLRALESGMVKRLGEDRYRSIDVRVVAATHRDLEEEVRSGRFRQDLYFRLAVALARVPPLRERAEDIPELVLHFAKQLGREETQLSPQLLSRLAAYPWPGNLRELRNVVARSLLAPESGVFAPVLNPQESGRQAQVPLDLPFKQAKERLVDAFTRDYVVAMLDRCGGNITQAAKAAGISRAYVHELVVKLALKASEE